MNKSIASIIIMALVPFSAFAQIQPERIELIECTPTKGAAITMSEGIIPITNLTKYSFKQTPDRKYNLINNNTELTLHPQVTNQGKTLTLHSTTMTLSVDLEQGSYILAGKSQFMLMPDGTAVGTNAFGTLYEGSCTIL